MDFSSAVTLNLEEEVNTTGAKKTTEGRSETSLKGGTKLVVSTKKKERKCSRETTCCAAKHLPVDYFSTLIQPNTSY